MALKSAIKIGQGGGLAQTEHYKIDSLDDSIWLSTNDSYGTPAEVRLDIQKILEGYAKFDEYISSNI